MIDLIVDSSMEYLTFGIVEKTNTKTKILFEKYTKTNNNHSEEILNILNIALSKTDLTTQQINRIIVGLGPGSFTALRVGITFAKALSYSLKTKIIGVDSLAALSLEYEDSNPTIVITNAKRKEIFFNKYFSGLTENSIQNIKIETFDITNYINENNIVLDETLTDLLPNIELSKIKKVQYPEVLKISKLSDIYEKNNINLPIKPAYIRPPDAIAPNQKPVTKYILNQNE